MRNLKFLPALPNRQAEGHRLTVSLSRSIALTPLRPYALTPLHPALACGSSLVP